MSAISLNASLKSLGIIGVGAFGEFMLKHLTPYFDITIYDARRDVSHLTSVYRVKTGTLAEAASCDIVIPSVPVGEIEGVILQIKDRLRKGQLVVDVASVKCLPTDILNEHLPDGVDGVSVHPLFGPQSGRYGIHGQNIAVVNVRGDRANCVMDFLRNRLDLNVIETTAEEHDTQMAYVQGLTHMIARVFKKIDMPEIVQETKTFSLLKQAIDIVKDDSDELFHAIQRDNPFVEKTKQAFFDSVRELEASLQEIKPHMRRPKL